MNEPLPDSYKEIANSMGISLYQRFSVNEASLFLRCQSSEVEHLAESGNLAYVKIADTSLQFFGYPLLGYLLDNVIDNKKPAVSQNSLPERIIRTKEVTELTGLSRTTLWRMEKTGEFPAKVSLGANSIGWRLSEIPGESHEYYALSI